MLDKVYPPSEDGAPGRGSGNRAASLPPPDRDRVTMGNETWKQRGGAKQSGEEIENEAQEDAEQAHGQAVSSMASRSSVERFPRSSPCVSRNNCAVRRPSSRNPQRKRHSVIILDVESSSVTRSVAMR